LLVLAVGLTVFGLLVRSYLPFLTDDALISLRYAQRLLAGKGLTWTDGECMEGYSNLLWVLCSAGLGGLGFDLIDATRILGVFGGGLAIFAVLYAHRPREWRSLLPPLAGVLALGLSGPVVIWAVGGLEQTLLGGLLAWALVLCYPLLHQEQIRPAQILLPGVLLGLIAVTRPDGILFTVTACMGLLLGRGWHKSTLKPLVFLALLPVLFYLAQLTFRLAYYDEWVPNTALVKVAFTSKRLSFGWRYVIEWTMSPVSYTHLTLPTILRV